MWLKYGLKAQKFQKQHALNQRSPAEGKGKGQKFQKQHALNQRSPAEGKGKGQKFQKQHALKGQKLLAQGIALGIMTISKAPCKGKSFITGLVFESFCPYRAAGLRP